MKIPSEKPVGVKPSDATCSESSDSNGAPKNAISPSDIQPSP